MGLGDSRGFARFCGVWELQVGFAGDGSGFSVFFGIFFGVLRGFSVFFGVFRCFSVFSHTHYNEEYN